MRASTDTAPARSDAVVLTRTVLCRSDPCSLWPFLADTERMNRGAGMRPLEIAALADESAARYVIRTRLEGFGVEYEERPFEWILYERFGVRRDMRNGPVTRLEFSATLAPTDDGGTRVTLEVRLTPRHGILRPVVRFSGERSLGTMAREVERADEEARRTTPARPPGSRVDEAVLGRLAGRLAELVQPSQRKLAAKLVEHVRTASDFDLGRIRPFELADDWGASRPEVLSTCLAAVVAGLLDLSWELVCPSCRTGAARHGSLAELPEDGHCQLCDLSFGVELDRAVEATFRPVLGVRAVDEGPYCVGGPARTPHVVAQAVAGPGGAALLRVPAEPGRYRVFVRGGATAAVEAVEGGAPSGAVSNDGQLAPARVEVAPGAAVRVELRADGERHVKLERVEWASRAATAFHVSTSATFRRLFSREALKPGLALKVGTVSLLFSDLTASTALYTRAGDATAFRLVQDHFDVLRAAIEGHGGAVVKTIGDAVMAAFPDEAAAVRAGLSMQRAWPAFREAHPHAGDVFLKVGVFTGPCYAVTANGALDYFGQTVNVAARLQALAEAGELVVPAELASRAEAEGWLEGARCSARFSASLKGLDAPVEAVRLGV